MNFIFKMGANLLYSVGRITGLSYNKINIIKENAAGMAVASLAITLLICFSCNQSKSKQVEVNKDTTVVFTQSVEKNIESSIFNNLTRLSQIETVTELSSNSVSIKQIIFSASDWEKIKRIYNQWRNEEIKKGNFQEKCPDISNEKDEDYADRLVIDALPKIPKQWKRDNEVHYNEGYIDTLMVDLNFDGRVDIILKIDQCDCMCSIGGGAPIRPTMFLTFISKGNQYVIDKCNPYINEAIQKIEKFKKEAGDTYDGFVSAGTDIVSGGLFIKSITSKDGIIIISGRSTVTESLANDPLCCPNFNFIFDFNYFMDKEGKGYAEIEGTYTDERQEVKKFFKFFY